MNGKINNNKKHRFFKFIILWSITFAFMFSCSMIIYAIAVNVDEDRKIETKENSIQIEIIDPNKAKLTHTAIKSEKVEISNVESAISIENTETQDDVSQEEVGEELSIQTDEKVINDEYSEEIIEEKSEPEYISLGEFRLTAYCPCEICCDECAYNRPVDDYGNTIVYTASGKIAQEGYTIAADPDVLPYGTLVYIDGHEYEVQDCGGAIIDNSIDIYFDNHEDACDFGLQYAEVFVKNI